MPTVKKTITKKVAKPVTPEELSRKPAVKKVQQPKTLKRALVALCIINSLLVGAVGFIGYSLYIQETDIQVAVTCENTDKKPVWNNTTVKRNSNR